MAALADEAARVIVVAGPISLTSPLVIPAGRALSPLPGGIISTNGNNHVVFAGASLQAGAYQIFDAEQGEITGLVGPVLPEWWGADSSGALDATQPIAKALSVGSPGGVRLAGRYLINNLRMPSRARLEGGAVLQLDAAATTGLRFSAVSDIEITGGLEVKVTGPQTALVFENGAERINLHGIKITSHDEITVHAGSAGIDVNNSYNIAFFACDIDHLANGVRLGTAANRVSFLGCNLRGSSDPNQSYLLWQSAGYGNAFSDGDIETQTGAAIRRTLVRVDGGSLTISGGWMEGGPKTDDEYASTGYGIEHTSGTLVLRDTQLKGVFLGLSHSNKTILSGNVFNDTDSSNQNPYIRWTSDAKGEIVLGPKNHAVGVLYRPGQYYSARTWKWRAEAREHILDSDSVYRADAERSARMAILGNYTYGGVRSVSNYDLPFSTWHIMGSIGLKKSHKTSSFDADEKTAVYLVSALNGAVVARLPHAAEAVERVYWFMKTDASGNPVTITPSAGAINGASALTLSAPYGSAMAFSDGSTWYAWIGAR